MTEQILESNVDSCTGFDEFFTQKRFGSSSSVVENAIPNTVEGTAHEILTVAKR